MSLFFIISGGLPPEARKAQALLFSTPDSGYDVLVASDAIGMGLNLSIKRIVFSTIEKFDGRTKRYLHPAVCFCSCVARVTFHDMSLLRSLISYPICRR